MSRYDPNVVIAEANQKLANDDWEGGQFVFQSHLLEWTDDAREGSLLQNQNDVHQLREAITTLYLAYAQYLITAKQYKSATEVYEDAIHTSVLASSNGRIYQEYARFLLERNKRKSAQDVFKQALVVSTNGQAGAVQDEQDRDILWNDFLEMMQMTNPDLTMKTLRQAVAEEQHSAELPPLKRRKVNEGEDSGNTSILSSDLLESNPSNNLSGETSKTHVVTLESVEQTAASLLPAWQALLSSSSMAITGLPPDILAAWMSRDGQDVPQAPEPPLFAPSPPKLSDPTAKDMLGVDLAVRLVQRLLNPSGGIVLEVCRALWMLQGLQEQSKYEAFSSLDARLVSEHERLESDLDARLSVAGMEMSEAVAMMNDRERQISHHQGNQQRQQLVYQSAWDFRQLLCLQQQVLAHLDVPGFEDGPTVDAETLQLQSYLCQYLHSAFYIRNRMGSEPHESMLKSQLKKLLKEQEQQRITGSHSPKMSGTASPANRNSPVPPPFHAQQSNTSMNFNAPMLPNNLSTQAYGGAYMQPTYAQATPQMMTPTGMPGQYPIQPQMMPGNGMYAPQMMMPQQPSYSYPMGPPYNGPPPNMPYGSQMPPTYPPYYQQ